MALRSTGPMARYATAMRVSNLAIAEARVRLIASDPTSELEHAAAVIARLGQVQVIAAGGAVLASMPYDSIEEVTSRRFWRVTGPDGVWMVRRMGGCRACSETAQWPEG